MAATLKKMFRGSAATSNTTLYTVPAGKTATVTNIVIANTNGSTATATISIDGVVVVPAVSIAANSVAPFDLKQVVDAAGTVSGFASTTAVSFHISGVEV